MTIVNKIKKFFVRENLTLQQIEQNKTIVKLFENEQFVIYTEFSHFKKYLQERIVKFKDSQDIELMKIVEQETLNNESVDAEIIYEKLRYERFHPNSPLEETRIRLWNLSHRKFSLITKVRADLLQKKKCRVYSKSTKSYVSKIVVLNYETDGFRYLAGERGRIFMGDGIEICSSVDCVS